MENARRYYYAERCAMAAAYDCLAAAHSCKLKAGPGVWTVKDQAKGRAGVTTPLCARQAEQWCLYGVPQLSWRGGRPSFAAEVLHDGSTCIAPSAIQYCIMQYVQ